MGYSVELSPNFKREAKKLLKKYPSLKGELANLFELLENEPKAGTPLGDNIYKIRLSIASKNKGKSGGARVLSYIKIIDEQVLLFSIYDKSDRSTMSDAEIKDLLKEYR